MKSKIKKIAFSLIALIILFAVMARYDLFNSYNGLRANYQIMTGTLVYPQCEFEGVELDRANEISSELGFKVVHVDCDKFYTTGMDAYYSAMSAEIEKRNGVDWLNRYTEKIMQNN